MAASKRLEVFLVGVPMVRGVIWAPDVWKLPYTYILNNKDS